MSTSYELEMREMEDLDFVVTHSHLNRGEKYRGQQSKFVPPEIRKAARARLFMPSPSVILRGRDVLNFGRDEGGSTETAVSGVPSGLGLEVL
jgi:hypothetical protein